MVKEKFTGSSGRNIYLSFDKHGRVWKLQFEQYGHVEAAYTRAVSERDALAEMTEIELEAFEELSYAGQLDMLHKRAHVIAQKMAYIYLCAPNAEYVKPERVARKAVPIYIRPARRMAVRT